MSKVRAYEVIDSNVLSKVVEVMNEKIREGWEPLGGIQVVMCSDVDGKPIVFFYQTIIKSTPTLHQSFR